MSIKKPLFSNILMFFKNLLSPKYAKIILMGNQIIGRPGLCCTRCQTCCFPTSVLEGKLMVIGGYKTTGEMDWIGLEMEVCGDVDLFCPKENKWKEGSKLNMKRWGLVCVVMDSGNWD